MFEFRFKDEDTCVSDQIFLTLRLPFSPIPAEITIIDYTGLDAGDQIFTEYEIEDLTVADIIEETDVEEFLNPADDLVEPIPDERSLLKVSKSRKYPSHMQATKAVAGSFQCPNCGQTYSQLKNMRRHVKLECGQEPKFPCLHCAARFKRNNQLVQHMAKRHCVAVASKFQC
jgi:uncharacterized C2H2 Zn-finger protein